MMKIVRMIKVERTKETRIKLSIRGRDAVCPVCGAVSEGKNASIESLSKVGPSAVRTAGFEQKIEEKGNEVL
jgi:hypothetical protein